MRRGGGLFFVFLFSFLFAVCSARAQSVGQGFGVQVKETVSREELRRIRAAGFGFVRVALYWDMIEKDKGLYDWSEADALLEAVRGSGLGAMLTLTSGHPAYDGRVAAPRGNIDGAAQRTRAPRRAESLDAFARFAAAAVLRYDAPDIVWEIWNEPDLPRFWAPAPSVSTYNALAARACGAIRAVRRAKGAVRVVGPALGRVPEGGAGQEAFLEAVLSGPAASCFDALSVHPYRYGAQEPEASGEDYKTLTLAMIGARFTKPLLRSEWGYSDVQTGRALQADYVLRSRFLDLYWGIERSVWYEWRDSRPPSQNSESGFGLTDWHGREKESLVALRELLPVLATLRFERRLPSGDPAQWLMLLRGEDGRAVLAGWRQQAGGESVCLESDGQRREALLTGRVQTLAQGSDITLCAKPSAAR